MRTIRKVKEPVSLAEHRSSTHADYGNYKEKGDLRSALAEQCGLCCYCLSRIPGRRGMKIEHWHSQDEFPGEQLDYANLLGACTGNEGQRWADQHCDARKGSSRLSLNPANPAHRVEDSLRYLGDGRIESTDEHFNSELNGVLNLNLAFLKNNRKAMLDGMRLEKRGDWPASELQKELRRWNGDGSSGDLEPYCQVVVYYLRKRLPRA